MAEHKKDSVWRERQRCLTVVSKYRRGVERRLAKGNWNNRPDYVAISEAILTALKGLEAEIERPKPQTGADFSFEELALAEEIIAEQEKNPFDGL